MIPAREVSAAADALSLDGKIHFTRRNLFYELARRGAIDLGRADRRALEAEVAEDVARFERDHGPLANLLRAEELRERAEKPLDPDAFDYAVRRVLVAANIDLFSLLVMNGFHRKVEIAVVTMDGFPARVWAQAERQLDAGVRTTFYALHDADEEGYAMMSALKAKLAPRAPRTADIGMTFLQALKIGAPIRGGARPGDARATSALDPEEARMLTAGSVAHVEELRPIDALRWVYARVARRPDDEGFG